MARSFDGANSKIAASSVVDVSTLTAFSFIAWVWANSAGESSSGKIMRAENAGGTVADLGVAAGPVLKFTTNYNTVNAAATASTALTINQWWCVAGTITLNGPDLPRLYQGSLTSAMAECAYTTQTQGSTVLQVGGSSLIIGNRTDQTLTWDGRIGFCAFYSRSLVLAETELFRQGRVPRGATYYWPLTQPDTTQSYEYIAGKNGTDTATTYTADPRSMAFYRAATWPETTKVRVAPFKPGQKRVRVVNNMFD